jgi:hypothetical protein
LRLGFQLIPLPMEPEFASGWRCPHRRPPVMGPIGNLVNNIVYCVAKHQSPLPRAGEIGVWN